MHDDKEDYRKQLWVNVATAFASASIRCTKEGMVSWANYAVDEFDKKFGRCR